LYLFPQRHAGNPPRLNNSSGSRARASHANVYYNIINLTYQLHGIRVVYDTIIIYNILYYYTYAARYTTKVVWPLQFTFAVQPVKSIYPNRTYIYTIYYNVLSYLYMGIYVYIYIGMCFILYYYVRTKMIRKWDVSATVQFAS